MKKLILAFLCLGLLSVFAQNPLQKITTKLQTKLLSESQSDRFLIWVYLSDKGNNLESYLANPQSVVSQKSLDRRANIFHRSEELLNFSDLPVNQNYVNELIQNGFELKQNQNGLMLLADMQIEIL